MKNEADRLAYIAAKKEFRVLEAAQRERAAKINAQRNLLAERDYWRSQGVKTAATDENVKRLRQHVQADTQRVASEYEKRMG